MPSRAQLAAQALWFESEPLCTRQRSRPVENGCECSVVTRLSVAIRVWPSAWLPCMSVEREALDELARRAGLLVDLDRLAGAHHAQAGRVLGEPLLGARSASVSTTITRVAAAALRLAGAERARERRARPRPSRSAGSAECSDSLHEPAGAGSR